MTTEPNASQSLRWRLRRETSDLHARLDSAVSRFDLGRPSGFAAFLGLQAGMFARLEAPAPAAVMAARDDLVRRARADLAALGRVPPKPGARIEAAPLAVTYLLSGSRLGGQVLRSRWRASTDPVVARAGAYFSAPGYLELWREFCDVAGRLPQDGPEADRVIRDARRLFRLFAEAAEELIARHDLQTA